MRLFLRTNLKQGRISRSPADRTLNDRLISPRQPKDIRPYWEEQGLQSEGKRILSSLPDELDPVLQGAPAVFNLNEATSITTDNNQVLSKRLGL
ncbi:hypothetical protein AOLI_G00201260 [Acnodon oligacanthus]